MSTLDLFEHAEKKTRTSRGSLRREHRDAGGKIRRVFVGWHQPLLSSAIEHLLTSYRRANHWDMDHVTIVLPSSLAGRRLQQLLAIRADDEQLLLSPPHIVTFGDLPERLYKAKFPFAGNLQQMLAWIAALQSMKSDELAPLLLSPPSSDETLPWVELAGLLASLHRELSSDLTLFADVIDLLDDDSDRPRWEVLAALQNRYLDALSAQKLWDIQTARRLAIEKREVALPAGQELVLLGTVDLNRAQRYFLDIVGEAVTVLVGAPESWRDYFDAYGALRGSMWQDIEIQVPEGRLVATTTATEVSEEVAATLAVWSAELSSQQITIGVPEASMVATVQGRLAASEIPSRLAAGVPIEQTPPMRLLLACQQFLESGSYESFAALIRLPAVVRVLDCGEEIPADFQAVIDSYFAETILENVRVVDLPQAPGRELFQNVLKCVDCWLAPLRTDRLPLQGWAEPICEVLGAAFGGESVDLDTAEGSEIFRACVLVSQSLSIFSDLPEQFVFETTFGDTIGWLARELQGERVAPLEDPQAVELLGWLELSLDDAPGLILTGVHDGAVPESVNSDPFLPNQIRTKLGLLDNSRRYARDCYILHVLLHARRRLKIIVNHLSVDGIAQTPSRLLLAVQPGELAPRIRMLLRPPARDPLRLAKAAPARPLQSNIPIPMPDAGRGAELDTITATDLNNYLYCPYRFYLQKFERLRRRHDLVQELEANTFGNLLHDTLEQLKFLPQNKLVSEEAVRRFLFEQLNAQVRMKFGKQPAPAVRVQVEQARQRLAVFATRQAAHAAAGWQIVDCEYKVDRDDGVSLTVDGRPVFLVGRIDRIDRHSETGRYSIWDYKTGDRAQKPLEKHYKKRSDSWENLQLPFYVHLIQALKIPEVPTLGYINLPKSNDGVAFEIAEFAPEQLAAADELIAELVRSIRDGHFWPPSYDKIYPNDEFRAITQHAAANRWKPELEPQIAHLRLTQLRGAASQAAAKPTAGATENAIPTSELLDPIAETTDLSDDRPPRIAPLLNDTQGRPPANWFESTLIRASAGSGKTYQLAQRIIKLLFADEPIETILATTFTRKAAGEILERVLAMLADAILDRDKFQQLREMLTPLSITENSCKYHLQRLCNDLHRLRVNTLDGFYNELARAFSLELALPPGWRLIDPFEEQSLQQAAVRRMFAVIDPVQLRSLLSQLSKGQSQRSVWRDILETVRHGYSFYRQTERSAWQHEFPIRRPSREELAAAVEGFAAVTREHKSWPGTRDTILKQFQLGDWEGFLKNSVVQKILGGDITYQRKELVPDPTPYIAAMAAEAAATEFEILQNQNQAAYELLANYHLQLEQVKTANRYVTFDDVSQRLSSWINRRIEPPNAPQQISVRGSVIDEEQLHRIAMRIDSRIHNLLLDEFQDTSPVQWSILQPFAQDVFSVAEPGSGRKSVFCVGDQKQAIYSWRGGVAELFNVVVRQLRGIREDTLAKSYRSSPLVIDFVNDVFKNLDRHDNYGRGEDAIKFWVDVFRREAHQTQRVDLPGYVQITNGPTSGTTWRGEATEDDEPDLSNYDSCVRDVAILHQEAPHVGIGILVRTNAEVTHMINLLRSADVPASQEGGNPLTDSAAVDLIISAVALADHPGDDIAAYHLRHSPLASKLFAGDATAVDVSRRIRWRIDRRGYAAAVEELALQLASECTEADQLRLEQLVQLAYRFERFDSVRLSEFVDYLRTERVSSPSPAAVRVMTIHQSKGLEFDAVFVPSLARGFSAGKDQFVLLSSDVAQAPEGVTRYVGTHLQPFMPPAWQEAFDKYAIGRLQDALCNFYVTLTRSRQALYIYTRPLKNSQQAWDSVLHSIFATGEQADEPDAIVHRSGDPLWYAAGRKTTSHKNGQRKSTRPPPRWVKIEPRLLTIPPAKQLRSMPRLRPSEAGQSRTPDLARAFEGTATIGSVVGKVVHRWFEDIRWIDDYAFDRNRARQEALDVLAPEEMPLFDFEKWLDKFERYLQEDTVRAVLSPGRYGIDFLKAKGLPADLRIDNERRILEFVDGKLLRGSIDRLVTVWVNDECIAAEIIDYKTDFLDELKEGVDLQQWATAKTRRHGPQLRMYRDAIGRQFKLDKKVIPMTLLLLSAGLVAALPTDE